MRDLDAQPAASAAHAVFKGNRMMGHPRMLDHKRRSLAFCRMILLLFVMSSVVACLKIRESTITDQSGLEANSGDNKRQQELASAKSYINAGNDAILKYQSEEASKNFEQAILILNGLIKTDNGDCDLFLNRGIAWMGKGDPALAGEDFTSCIRLCPGNDVCYLRLGKAYKSQNKLDSAQNEFNIIIAKGKYADQAVLSDAYFQHGLINIIQEYYWDAVTDFTKAVKLVPDDLTKQNEIIYYRAIANYRISFLWNPPNQAYKKMAVQDMAQSCQLGNSDACQWDWNNNIVTQVREQDEKKRETDHKE